MWIVAVICEDMDEIRWAYNIYLKMLKMNEPENIVTTYPAAFCIEVDETYFTGSHTRYLFTDDRMAKALNRQVQNSDITDIGSFFEMLQMAYQHW